jgi:two-component system, NarL family, nitrate/nitrite response regulator NarL
VQRLISKRVLALAEELVWPASGSYMDASRIPIHILIADDHTLFRKTLRNALDSEKHFLIVGEAGDGKEALKLAELLEPDILLLSWQLLRHSGMDILRSLSSSGTRTQIILLAEEIDRDQTGQAFQLGVRGLVLKESSIEVLISGVHSIMAGRYWLGNESFSSLDEISKNLNKSKPRNRKPKDFKLTPQELKIIAAAASGCTNRSIAKQMSISEQTVKHHITSIFCKLGVSSRLELALFALHSNLIKDSD